jgi:hypothetical protein
MEVWNFKRHFPNRNKFDRRRNVREIQWLWLHPLPG